MMAVMKRANLLLQAPAYRDYMEKISRAELERAFCRHDLHHCLEVARLCWLFLLEAGADYPREVVYGAALLHDIGRWMEYRGQGCHAGLGAKLAEPLLTGAGYTEPERELITAAISEHRREEDAVFSSSLSYYLRQADKYSRPCFTCAVGEDCYKKDQMPQCRELFY